MPIYEYQCDKCGRQDEKLWKSMSSAKETIPCAACEAPMRKLISAANFAFVHPKSQTRGIAPPNTGTSADWNFDQAIGRDAEEKWKTIEKRDAHKESVIRDERKAGKIVTKDQLVLKNDGSGEYRTIKETERVKVNENRVAAHAVTQAAKKQLDASRAAAKAKRKK